MSVAVVAGAGAWLALVLQGAPAAQEPPASHPREIAASPLPLYVPPPVERRHLACGVDLLVVPERGSPLVEGRVAFRAGTACEPSDRTGLVPVLGEALRRGGSETLDGTSLDAWLDARAATLEVRVDARRVELDFTCLAEDLDGVLERVADLLASPAYPQRTVERVREGQAREVERRHASPAGLAQDLVEPLAYGADSPFARFPDPDAVRALDRADLLAFHRAWLGRDRMLVGLRGELSTDDLATRLDAVLAALPVATSTEEPRPPAFIQPGRTRIHVVDRPGSDRTELRLVAPGVRLADPDAAPLRLWSSILGAPGTGRLAGEVEHDARLARDVAAGFEPGWGRAGRFVARATTPASSAEDCLAALLETLGASLDVSRTELAAARSRAAAAELRRVDGPSAVLERAFELAFHGYPQGFWEDHLARLREVSTIDVAGAVRRRFSTDRLIVIAVGPADALVTGLQRFGEVVVLDPADLLSRDTGQPEEVERLLDAIGGRSLWSRLVAVEADVAVWTEGKEYPTRQWHDLRGPRLRVDYQVEGATVSTGLERDRSWVRTSNAEAFLPDATRDAQLARKRESPWELFYRLARGVDLRATRGPEGEILLEDDAGTSVVLRVGEDGRPSTLAFDGGARTVELSDWRLQDGYSYPARVVEVPSGTEWRVERFRPLVSFDPRLLEPPQ